MKVFNLACENGHEFEGWFGSTEAYEQQSEQAMLSCPVCDSDKVQRLPSAPRLNLATAEAPPRRQNDDGSRQMVAQPTAAQLQELWLKMAQHIEQNTEDVGEHFAEEARKIHYHEAPERGIRGRASADEAEQLAEEGIEVMAFPMPSARKGPLQ